MNAASAADAAAAAHPLIASASNADILTVACAVLFVVAGLILRAAKKIKRAHVIGAMIGDLLQGASFFPFTLLAASIGSRAALQTLLESNRAILALSGLIAAFYVLSEFIKLSSVSDNG